MGNGIRYGLASMQGWRMEMEDAHSAVTGLPGHLSAWSYFAVFDGHAGHSVSTRCAEELLGAIVDTDDFKKLQPETAPTLEEIQKGIREGFLNLDQKMRHSLESNCEDKSGSTAVCVLTSPSHFYFVNCGDSRSILIRDNVVVFSTTDHKPSNPDEKARITKAGGSVMIQRVNGSLAVSRSLGDYEYKNVKGVGPTEQLVSPEPEISIVDRDEKSDQIIVLACDGVWDVMSNDDVANFVTQRMKVTENLIEIANEVIDTCFFKNSRDNMSIVIVALPGAPKVDPEMAEKDRILNSIIEDRVRKLMFDEHRTEMNEIVSAIVDMPALPDLPPGGGLCSKRRLIEDLHTKFLEEIRSKEETNLSQSGPLSNTNNDVSDNSDQITQSQGEQ